ncbi:MAG TPA: lytic murein transglycosylase [Candidatus Binatia bacterium]
MLDELGGGSRARRALGAIGWLLLATLGGSCVSAVKESNAAPPERRAASASYDHRGWGYLIEKLVADGVDRRRVERTFADPRIEPFTGLDFGLRPREPKSLYSGFAKPSSVALARRCHAEHAATLAEAERIYGVPASVIAAIIHIESGCGRNTGSEVVLYRLARLAMANEPANLQRNIERHAFIGGSFDPEIAQLTRERAQYLEDTFYPEVLATFQLADRLDIDPLGIRGSGSGAFGMPQFLPRSYLSYGVDGNGDGRISLYDPDDAIHSCANYLASHGWRPGLSRAERRQVIWHYNRSDAYIDAVLQLSAHLDGAPVVQTAARKSPPKKPTKTAVARKPASKPTAKTKTAAKGKAPVKKASPKQPSKAKTRTAQAAN